MQFRFAQIAVLVWQGGLFVSKKFLPKGSEWQALRNPNNESKSSKCVWNECVQEIQKMTLKWSEASSWSLRKECAVLLRPASPVAVPPDRGFSWARWSLKQSQARSWNLHMECVVLLRPASPVAVRPDRCFCLARWSLCVEKILAEGIGMASFAEPKQ